MHQKDINNGIIYRRSRYNESAKGQKKSKFIIQMKYKRIHTETKKIVLCVSAEKMLQHEEQENSHRNEENRSVCEPIWAKRLRERIHAKGDIETFWKAKGE